MATIYAVNVYPENIKPALLDEKLKGKVTSRFAMKTAENKNTNQQLEIYIELSRGQQETTDLEKQVQEMIVKSIKKANSEFNKLTETVTREDLVRVILRPFQDRDYFSSDKQKYVLNPKIK
jgi:phenylacetate-CoA ligase